MNRRMKKGASLLLAAALSAGLCAVPSAAETGYSDVPDGAWYADAAVYCRQHGIMNGGTDGRFSPDRTMTRAMLASVLYRLAGSPAVEDSGRFSDVPAGSWCSQAVAWAARTGVVNGYADGRFGADDPVTRQQFAAMLWRSAGCPEGPRWNDFADESAIESYAAQAVDWARSRGVINGKAGNRFDPTGPATRAQAAVILKNYLTNGVGEISTGLIDGVCAPSGIALAEDGTVYVTDVYNKVIWSMRDGESQLYAGKKTAADIYGEPVGGYNDGTLAGSIFAQPWAIAPFLDGWAVSDTENHVIRLARSGGVRTILGGKSGKLTLDRPTGLTADDDGNLYIADTEAGVIYKVTPQGRASTAISGLSEPMGLCWYRQTLYIAEAGANRIVKLTGGKLVTVAGSGEEGLADGSATDAAFSGPQAVTVDGSGVLYVSDTGNSAVRRIKEGQVTTLAARDPADTEAGLFTPAGLLVKGKTLYVCDGFARKIFSFAI